MGVRGKVHGEWDTIRKLPNHVRGSIGRTVVGYDDLDFVRHFLLESNRRKRSFEMRRSLEGRDEQCDLGLRHTYQTRSKSSWIYGLLELSHALVCHAKAWDISGAPWWPPTPGGRFGVLFSESFGVPRVGLEGGMNHDE